MKWWILYVTFETPMGPDFKSYKLYDINPYYAIGYLYSTSIYKIKRIDYSAPDNSDALIGINEFKPLNDRMMIPLPMKITQDLYRKLAKYCYERCIDEL